MKAKMLFAAVLATLAVPVASRASSATFDEDGQTLGPLAILSGDASGVHKQVLIDVIGAGVEHEYVANATMCNADRSICRWSVQITPWTPPGYDYRVEVCDDPFAGPACAYQAVGMFHMATDLPNGGDVRVYERAWITTVEADARCIEGKC